MKHVGETPEVAVDWTKCFGYEKLISEEVEHYSSIEVTEDLKEGGIAANQAWERWYRFLAALWRTDFVSEIVAAARGFEAPRLLSLGCGYGGMEVDCARRLSQLGGPYEVLAVDVNENLFRGARQEAARDGLRLEFLALDLNFVELEENAFDVVFAHASLHHLLNFEHLFAQVHRALRSGGRLIVLDIIGKTQVLFWPENIRFATDLVARMPERYRRGLAADPQVLFSSYLDGAEQQGMEGIRQEELEEQIGRYFRPIKMHKYNSFVRLICTHPTIALAFDPERAEDQAYLDSMFRLDLEQIAKGALRATEMFAVYEKRPSGELPSGEPGPGSGRVSVLVACDGSAEELKTCFASLLAQTHTDLEIVLMPPADNGGVLKLAHELAASHPRVRVLPVEGPDPASWRRGLDSATGEYIALLSSRDTWYPVKLAAQLAFLEGHPAAGLT
ncbi:MAG: methyltransferase domain-containing protein, partial [Thermoanaerobaculia bacterium]